MARELSVKLNYSAEKDLLSIIVQPEREVETKTKGYEHGILIFYENGRPQAITGMEALDFSEMVGGLNDNLAVFPVFDFTFNVAGSSLRGIDFKDLLKWAYGEFIAKAELEIAA